MKWSSICGRQAALFHEMPAKFDRDADLVLVYYFVF